MSVDAKISVRKNQFEDFFNLPAQLFGKQYPYVSQFKPDLKRFLSAQNPLFKGGDNFEFLVAYRDSTPLARLVVHEHRESNSKYNTKIAYFGYFECADDDQAVNALFSAAEEWARARGLTSLMGNINLTVMQQMGVVVEGFDRMTYTDQVFNSPNVPRQLDRLGYERFFPMTTYELNLKGLDPKKFVRPADEEKLNSPRYKFEQVKKKNLNQSLEHIRQILNEGFADNPMFVDVTQDEFMFQAKDMMWIIDERLTYLSYVDGEPAGTSVVIPDLNPLLQRVGSKLSWKMPFEYLRYLKNRKRALLIFGSVKKKFHQVGIGTPTFYLQLKSLIDAGYESLGITWISDENTPARKHMERSGAKALHKTCLFKKQLN